MTRFVPSWFERHYGDNNCNGTSGSARIQLLHKANSSKTGIAKLSTEAPLLVQRALYPDVKYSGMAHIYLMSSAGGVLQGDRLEIELDAGCGTMSRITTQSATKIYRMDKGFAAQWVRISAGRKSYLEFLSRQLIPFGSSRFCQDVSITVGDASNVVYSETVAAGRTASGERFDFDACYLRLQATDPDGRLLFSDVCNMEPERIGRDALERLFGGKAIWSTVYAIVDPSIRARVEEEIGSSVQKSPLLAGYSMLPNDCGLVVRMLDDSIDRVENMIMSIAQIVRSLAASNSMQAEEQENKKKKEKNAS